jgi:zinc/manganese transport system permease protein
VSWDLGVLWPALFAGLLVALTHVPLGVQVLDRGIVFLDLAVAHIAALGVVFAGAFGFDAQGVHVQLAALAAALAGALLLNWTDRRWPQIQEAVIGVAFIVAANAAILLLAANPHGAEHLRDLLVGQILWVSGGQLAWALLVSALIAAVWFGFGRSIGRVGFYVVFACAVTLAVQLVGIYLVFATLIIPALATRQLGRSRIGAGYAVAALSYAGGLVLSMWSDLPAGPLVVCTMTILGLVLFMVSSLLLRS